MFQLVYASTETVRFSHHDLVLLLEKSRARNAGVGITGMLLYQHGNFLQVLEGDEPTVRTLYERIALDPRHARSVVLHEGHAPRREFPDWSMGFRDLDSVGALDVPGFSRFLQSGISAAHFVAEPPRAKALLLAFKHAEEASLRATVPPRVRAG